MPLHKHVSNQGLTLAENILLGAKLSEYYTGYRAFSRRVLETLPLLEAPDDFVFDNQMLAQSVVFGFKIGEISCPTKYIPEGSSIPSYADWACWGRRSAIACIGGGCAATRCSSRTPSG